MSSFHEFHEPIAVDTPLGPGRAILIERTPHDYLWTVALNEGGAAVAFTQDRIRIHKSYTYRRGISDEQMREHVKPPGGEETVRDAHLRDLKRRAWDQAAKDFSEVDEYEPGPPGRMTWQRS